MEAFDALQKKSKVLLEDSILTKLHNELVLESSVIFCKFKKCAMYQVTRAEFKEAERTISEALHGTHDVSMAA